MHIYLVASQPTLAPVPTVSPTVYKQPTLAPTHYPPTPNPTLAPVPTSAPLPTVGPTGWWESPTCNSSVSYLLFDLI